MKKTIILLMLCWALGAIAAEQTKAYCVIDLSGGTKAANYPVSYLEKIPDGGWTEEHRTSKLVLKYIAPGTFTMGSPADEYGRETDEVSHQVTLSSGFYIGVFEVTREQWELVMGDSPCHFKRSTNGGSYPVESVSYDMIRGKDKGSEWPESAEVDESSFIGVLRKKTGDGRLDLPTEAQWEYACRAGTKTAFSNGGSLASTMGITTYKDFGKEKIFAEIKATERVGSYAANPWGLYDMHGSVLEWCLDFYVGPLAADAATDPKGDDEGVCRVLRGGTSFSKAEYCRSAARFGSILPSDACYDIGFRLVMNDGTGEMANASDKTASDKTASDKTTSDKGASDKGASDKGASDKTASDKTASDKTVSDKTASDKTASDKTASDKATSDKNASDAGKDADTAGHGGTIGTQTGSDRTSQNSTSQGTAGTVKPEGQKTNAPQVASQSIPLKTSTEVPQKSQLKLADGSKQLLSHLSFDDYGNNGLNVLKVQGTEDDAVVRVNPDKVVNGLGEVKCVTDKAVLAGLAEGDGAVEIPCRTHIALPIPEVLTDAPGHEYTIVMKVKFKDFVTQSNCLLNMPANNPDCMAWLDRGNYPSVILRQGSRAESKGGFYRGNWETLAFQFQRSKTRVLLNGREILTQNIALASSRADCSKAGGYFLLSADDNGGDAPMYWADVKVYDGVFEPWEKQEIPPEGTVRLLSHLSFDDNGNNGLNLLKVEGTDNAVVRDNPDKMLDNLGKVKWVTDKAVLAGLAEGDGAVEIPCRTHIALPIPFVLSENPNRPYTIVMKVKFKDFVTQSNCLLNMPANNPDIMAWVDSGNYPSIILKQGSRVDGKGGFYRGNWETLAFQFQRSKTRVLLNGREILTQNIALASSRADCSKAGGYFLLSADDNGDDAPMYWADVKVYDGVFEPWEKQVEPPEGTVRLLSHLSFDDNGNNGLNLLKVDGTDNAVVRDNPDKMLDNLGKVKCVTDKAVLAGLEDGDGAVEIPCRTHIALPIPFVLSDNPNRPYTIVMKVKFKDFVSQFNCLLNMPANNPDVMAWVDRGNYPSVILKQGGRVESKGGFYRGNWETLAFQFQRNKTRVLLNGREILSQNIALASSHADCSQAGGYFLLSADDNGDDAPMYWADVKVYDGVFEPEEKQVVSSEGTGRLLSHLSFDDYGNNGLNVLKVEGTDNAVVRENPTKMLDNLGAVKCVTDKAVLAGLTSGDGAVEIPCRTHIALPIPFVLSDNPGRPYTIAMKVKFKDFSNQYNCLLNMPANNPDIMAWVEQGQNPRIILKHGARAEGKGEFTTEKWHLLVFQFNRNQTKVLLDGTEILSQNVALASTRADCSKAGGYFLLSADDSGDDGTMYWADVKVYDGIVMP